VSTQPRPEKPTEKPTEKPAEKPPEPAAKPHGRGAWPKDGAGGTLSLGGTEPGAYYVLADIDSGLPLVGSGGWNSTNGDERAVHGGTRAIQRALNRRGKYGLRVTGKFDIPTRDAAVEFQRSLGSSRWGGIGQSTAKALFLPDLQSRCKALKFPAWEVVCGVVQNESAWDPGAVGKVKPVDIGLAQINGDAHPDMSERERLSPTYAFTFIIRYLTNAMKALDGNVDYAIASYNLGITGCRRWVALGCPEWYTPPGSVPRNVPAYIARIKDACIEKPPPEA
jgi:hypothetical protein